MPAELSRTTGRPLEATSKHWYADLARTHLEDETDAHLATPLSEVKAGTIRSILGVVAAKPGRTPGQPLSPTTVRGVYATLDRAIAAAVESEVISVNAVRSVRRPTPAPPRHAVLQEDALAKALALVPDRYRIGLDLFIATGARRGDIMGLRWRDVHLDSGLLVIEESLVERRGPGARRKSTKSEDRRVLPLPDRIVTALRKHRTASMEAALAGGWQFSDDTPLVVNLETGRSYAPSTLTRVWRECARTAGLSDTRLHALRHRAAGKIQAAGVPVAEAARILGHRDVATTLKVYSSFTSEGQQRAMDALEGANEALGG